MSSPRLISEFRPISLCSVLYKILSKVLANRVFILWRHIRDNALIAFEGGVSVPRESNVSYGVLTELGLADYVVFKISDINGEVKGRVVPTRGLRQGAPILPYLFILCAEALSSLLARATESGGIHGVQVCRGGPRISHLLFADDCLIFARANVHEGSILTEIFSVYERASGQKINM
ncbi:hypothetical protein V2J09_002321 [Rumex salicifolius]